MRINKVLSLAMLLALAGCGESNDTDTATTDAAETSTEQVAETVEMTGSIDKSDEMAKIAYAMGANSGQFLAKNIPEFKSWGMDFDIDLVKKGFLESLDSKSQMDEQEIQTVLMAFQGQITTKLAEIEAKQATATTEANQLFLAENATKEGVQTTDSGLQYKIIEEGTGASPTVSDTVLAHYRGTLIDGTEFDSSYSRNAPSKFTLSGVIPGWTEALQLLKIGGKIELALPPELGYGARAIPKIPANSVLKFEIHLVEIVALKPAEPETTK
jgi:FKBP-type peptidyl-prolyl cis-trans isomerase FkpA